MHFYMLLYIYSGLLILQATATLLRSNNEHTKSSMLQAYGAACMYIQPSLVPRPLFFPDTNILST